MAKFLQAVRVALNLRTSDCGYLWQHYADL